MLPAARFPGSGWAFGQLAQSEARKKGGARLGGPLLHVLDFQLIRSVVSLLKT